ncbi:MAG: hypothetical protein KatS3mg014_2741 [Actinomycetota bacterium]|nr:MAG: hypothetical protein KatS3mg014_2741 [Actinomycetota bacterium]
MLGELPLVGEGVPFFEPENRTRGMREVNQRAANLYRKLNNKVHWEDINGNPLGAAKVCTDADNKIYTFAFAFDPDCNWSSGSEDPGPSQADLRWVAAHEFGHAAGYSHHRDDSHNHLSCPEDSTKHTMCSTATLGQAWGRTLEIHDVHTFTDAY